MNRWIMLRRLRGPAFLLLFGLTALLNQWDILSFGQSWPLYLILWGVFSLAERAAFIGVPPPPPVAYPGAPSYAPPVYGPTGGWTNPSAAPSSTSPGSALVPQQPADLAPSDDPDWQKGGH